MNPYDWQRHHPRIEIPRPEVAGLAERLGCGKSGVLLAGRGMGKSVFLRQLKQAIEGLLGPEVRVILLTAPPSRLTTLVPESVFAAFLALGLEMLGWQAEREAQHGAGRTDLKLRWNGGSELALVELKIWGREGYRQVQRQLEKYWSAEVVAGAVVMLTDAEIPDWEERYRRECLAGLEVEWVEAEGSPVRGRFTCRSRTADGRPVVACRRRRRFVVIRLLLQEELRARSFLHSSARWQPPCRLERVRPPRSDLAQ